MAKDQDKMNQLLELETDFGFSLLRQQNLNESLVFSPLSISLALSLLHVAANGQTKDQIREALAKGVTDEQIEQHYSDLMKKLEEAENGTEINIANRIFSNNLYQVKQEYLENVHKLFNSGAEALDFKDTVKTANTVNKYVSDQTRGNINEIIKADGITDDVLAYLINALYFKGKWMFPFKSFNNVLMDFYSNENLSRQINFMTEYGGHWNIYEDDIWQILQLPYKDKSYSLNIFLPRNRFGLQDALKNINGQQFQKLLNNYSRELVNIKIPKMRIESELNLEKTLKALGIVDAFSSDADLSKLADDIYVSSAVHKSLIDVDEDGTTAAAVTAIEVSLESAVMYKKDPIEFVADHPFLFVLAKDCHPLFIGIHM